jgi:hypothetical protein
VSARSRTSIAERLNDPYECSSTQLVNPSDQDFERLLRRYEKEHPDADFSLYRVNGRPSDKFRRDTLKSSRGVILENLKRYRTVIGISCFAERWDDLLMWSHYARGHRGFCIELDVQADIFEGKIRKMRYAKDLAKLNPAKAMLNTEDDGWLIGTLYTKNKGWAYEREWRMYHHEGNRTWCYGQDALTAIYLGTNLDSGLADMIFKILEGSKTKMFRMIRSETRFAVEAETVRATEPTYT